MIIGQNKEEINPLALSQYTIDDIINYCKNTTEDSWCTDVVKTKDGKNCLLGHVFDLGGSKLMDDFEYIATSYMVFPVNDGNHPKYQQSTPKLRCIKYLEDLRDGKEKTTIQIMEEYEKE